MEWKELKKMFRKPGETSATAAEMTEKEKAELLARMNRAHGDVDAFEQPEQLPPMTSKWPSRDANNFAFDLVGQLCNGERRNLVVSPFGIEALLALVREGASGETRAELSAALRLADTDVSEAVALAKHYVERAAGRDEKSRNAKLEFANSLWINEQYEVRPEFVEVARREHMAEPYVVNMNSEETARLMNFWAAEKTHGLINSVPGAIDAETVLALVNAIYFKGLWSASFKKEHTRPAEFHLRDGRTVMRRRMRRKLTCPYYEGQGFKSILLGYIGGRFAMHVFLPEEMDAFRSGLTAGMCSRAIGQSVECTVELPKVKLRFKDTDLVESLKAMGVRRLFEPGAELQGIAQELYVSKVAQEAVVNVDEEGTEAAAVSMMVSSFSSIISQPAPREYEFIVDRPYFFTIEDMRCRRVLFAGFVEDPEE